MKHYLEINKHAYNNYALEFNSRWKLYIEHQKSVLRPFEQRLKHHFKTPITVLDVGCGVGLDAYILTEHQFRVHGIDFARNMINYAKKNVPKANFKEVDFFKYIHRRFHGIVMSAFFHLFPKKNIPLVVTRIKSLLMPGGYGLICTTENKTSHEGYFEKKDCADTSKRFRKFWTKKELKKTLEKNGLKIVHIYTNYEPNLNKHWMCVIFQVKK